MFWGEGELGDDDVEHKIIQWWLKLNKVSGYCMIRLSISPDNITSNAATVQTYSGIVRCT